MAILLVEHDLDMVAEAVDRVVAMDLGSVLAEGSFSAVIDDPRVRAAYFGQVGSS
jgi:ABC-type branched-subunit amino acid transport system ATPase component